MGIRETLNRNPAITTGATAGLIVVAMIWIFWTTYAGSDAAPRGTALPPASRAVSRP